MRYRNGIDLGNGSAHRGGFLWCPVPVFTAVGSAVDPEEPYGFRPLGTGAVGFRDAHVFLYSKETLQDAATEYGRTFGLALGIAEDVLEIVQRYFFPFVHCGTLTHRRVVAASMMDSATTWARMPW